MLLNLKRSSHVKDLSVVILTPRTCDLLPRRGKYTSGSFPPKVDMTRKYRPLLVRRCNWNCCRIHTLRVATSRFLLLFRRNCVILCGIKDMLVRVDNCTALTRIKPQNKGVTQTPEKHSFVKCNWVDTRYDNSSSGLTIE